MSSLTESVPATPLGTPQAATNAIFLGALVLVTSYILMKKSSRNTLYSTLPKVPGARPIIGNYLGKLEKLIDTLEAWAALYGEERGFFLLNIFGIKVIVVCNEKNAAVLESLRPFKAVRRKVLSDVLDSLGSNGVLSAEGDTWKRERKLVGPALNRKNVRNYVATIKLVGTRLMNKWAKTMEREGVVTANSDLLLCTMDIISLVAFGNDIDGVTKGESKIGDDMKITFKAARGRLLSPFPFWKIPVVGQYIDGAGWPVKRLKRSFAEFIKESESKLAASSDKDDMNKSEAGKTHTFLKTLLELNKKDATQLSAERMTGNLMTMFAAGSETTFVTLVSSLYEIAIDKSGLQEELAAEVLALEEFDGAGLEELNNGLPRLRSLVYEVLRLKGPSPLIGMESREQVEVDGTLFPPRTNFMILSQYISTLESSEVGKRTPRGARDAPLDSFCPRRWLISTEDGKGPSVRMPTFRTGFRAFGEGRRVCPGRELAEMEILIILSMILRKFEICLEEGHPPMELVSRFTSSPNIDVNLELKPRRTS